MAREIHILGQTPAPQQRTGRQVIIGEMPTPTVRTEPIPILPKVPGLVGKTSSRIDKRHRLDAKSWAQTGRWVQVKSSNVNGISYKVQEEKLFVEFKDKGKGTSVYVYYAVPLKVVKDFFNASSLGKFLWRRIRGRFAYAKIK